jgi:hypothetical protein
MFRRAVLPVAPWRGEEVVWEERGGKGSCQRGRKGADGRGGGEGMQRESGGEGEKNRGRERDWERK